MKRESSSSHYQDNEGTVSEIHASSSRVANVMFVKLVKSKHVSIFCSELAFIFCFVPFLRSLEIASEVRKETRFKKL